ncbi:nuclear pore complex protein Nup98-Nup96-like isoform X1 [Pocillopora damicornis]|uniref:nuclear pore complex protein Nup98-Nup96-like isoform X1 n=1 Tax=Pocillopora damicornis TaxID=46731 RepID=UPI000F556AA3|nr:nuclear pore complex protein Nup98-Nup96-like isoform X1 [Pocillopora damicornis]XP_027054851.1 nuclear pore complex protein Nup98-Nup96-like isoform X1 [Pocillopora damicornis]
MFGSTSSTPFGTGSTFGTGTTFGGQTSTAQFGAGGGTGLFGNNQKPLGFGSTFTQPQASGTSTLFGGTNTGSIFGGTGTTTGNIFGQQQPTSQSSFGGFGTTGGGLFGSTAKTTAGTSVFNTGGQTTFGSTATSGFGSSAGSSLFGSNATKGTGLFGSTQAGSSLFGQTSAANTANFGVLGASGNTALGTPVKFNVVPGTDSMVKNGITTNISVRHQCITVMANYDKKSLEELRIEDYEAGRKTGATGATGATGSTGFPGLATSSAAGSLFGNTASTGFGAAQKPATGFGTTGVFGAGNTTTSGLFAQQQQTTGGLFAQQKTGGLFGAQTSSAGAPAFATGFGTGVFGQTSSGQTTQSGLFGGTSTSTGTGLFATQSSGFGQTQTGTGGLFGQTGFGLGQQQSTAFGKPFGALGTGATGTLFGAQNKPATGFNFGASAGGLGTSAFNTATSQAGGLFGAKPTTFGTGTAFGTNTGTGLFGTTGTLGAGTGLNAGTLGTFGTLGAQQTSLFGGNALGGNQNTALTTLQQQQQQKVLEQQLLILSNSPFGDSPLFRNSLLEKSKPERASTATTSSLQKVVTTPSHYKVSPRPAARIKPKPINNHTMNKSKLFEGLEEDSGLSPDTFVPRKNIKKLVLKTKSSKEDSPLSVVDTTRVKLSTLEGDDSLPATRSPLPPSPPPSQDMSPMRLSATPAGLQSGERSSDDRVSTSAGVSPMGVRFSRVPDSVDTTISELNVRRLPRRDEEDGSVKGSVIGEDSSSDTTSRDNVGVVLKRLEYYTVPPVQELNQQMDSNGDIFVNDFVVGREGYGKVKFYGRTNVAGLNLDEIVFFRRREIEVYPDTYLNKPPVGEELNKKAEITLENVWPSDKTTREPIKSPERLNLLGWQKRVETATEKLGATFLDFNLHTGYWVFTVDHFTRYRMDDEFFDDEQAQKKLKRPPLKSYSQDLEVSIEKEKEEIFRRLQEKKQQLEVYEKKKQQAALSSLDQDSVMADIDQQTFPEEMLEDQIGDGSDGEEEVDSSPASHQLASALGMNAQRIQVMKASFFADPSQLAAPFAKDSPTVDKSLFSSSLSKAGHLKSSVYPPSMPLGPLLSPKVQRSVDESRQMSQSLFGSPQIGVYPLRYPLVHDVTPVAPPSPIQLPSAIGTAMDIGIKVVGARNQFGLVPKKDSLVNGKENLIADAGLMMGRSFRVGWGPGFVLVHSGTPLGKQEGKPAPPTSVDFLSMKPRPSSSEGSAPFGVTIEKLNVALHDSRGPSGVVLEHVRQQHETVLEAQLQHTVVSSEEHCPFFQPSSGVKALHHHAEVARRNKEATDPGPLRDGAEQICLVWDLVVALWGKLTEDDDDDDDDSDIGAEEDRETYQNRVARKQALSNWLAEAAKTKISQEVDNANFQESDHLKSIFSYLTGKQISRACREAQLHGDYRLSLLLSQVTGNTFTRNLLYKQLADWQEMKADVFINRERIKIYALLAGVMVWEISRDPASQVQSLMRQEVNVCEGLDWKRVLAVHLWYFCSPTCSIADALQAYESSFKGSSSHGRYGASPHPPYVEEDEEDEDENKFITRDTCYHLLKLYCKRSHRLERLLSPSTSTALQLDFRLSWHLYQVLLSLHYTHLSERHAAMLHCEFAAQLEGLGLWHWAAFVLLHIEEPTRRENVVRSLLCRYCCVSEDHANSEKERFMLNKLKIPAEWIHEAKALRARYEGKTREEAFHLVKARHWSLGHSVILRSLVSDAIINAEYDFLKTLLKELEARDRSSTVKDWATGGQVFLDYLSLMEKFQDISKENFVPTKYDWEGIYAEVTSLCSRINSLTSDIPKDMLCQYDMAKMCANFLKIVLKELTDLTDEGEALLPTHILVPHVTKLPMPEDCTVEELRQLIPSYIQEIAAEN